MKGGKCMNECKTQDILGPDWSKGMHHKTSKHPHGVGHKKPKKRGGKKHSEKMEGY